MRDGGRVGVLVIDDHAPFRDAARAVVAAAPGFEAVAEADSGAQGIAVASVLRPDLVLLDLNMPGLDGVETCRVLKERHPDAVVVLISVDASLLEEARGGCCADAFLLKQDFGTKALLALWAEHGALKTPA